MNEQGRVIHEQIAQNAQRTERARNLLTGAKEVALVGIKAFARAMITPPEASVRLP